MTRILTAVGCVILFAALLTGCSGNPVSPGDSPGDGLTDSRTGESVQPHYCFGYYTVVLDTVSHQVNILPLRSGEMHINITNVLNTTMGVSAAGVPAEHDPANGIFVFDVTLTHPFGTKPQLAGFDVKGILMTPGTLGIGPLVFADVDETRLLNADGYTRWWNPTEFTNPGLFGYTHGSLASAPGTALTATVNPYKYFADVLGTETDMTPVYAEPIDSDVGRGVFKAGSSNTRRYRIQFPMDPGPQIVFGYAVDASWQAPAPNPPTEVPDDFGIEANDLEAFHVHPVATINTLYHDSESGKNGGVLRFLINVHDWQGIAKGGIADQVSAVRIFSPDLLSGFGDGVFENENSYRAQYSADLTSLVAPTQSGQELVAVRAGSEGGPSYDQGFGPAPSDNISAWDTLIVEIEDPECTADANNDWIDAVEMEPGGFVTDHLCSPTDYRDFFEFEILPGFDLDGALKLWCDLDPCKLELYDESQGLITEADAVGGVASIDFETLDMWPGTYFIRVYTSDDSFPAPYLLEFTGELTNVIPNPVDITPDGLYCDPEDVIWDGDYIYMASRGGFWIFDASDPANSELLVQERWYVDGGMAKYGDTIYFLESAGIDDDGLSMVDVSDPSAPIWHRNIHKYTFEVKELTMNSTHLFVGSKESPLSSEVLLYDWVTDPVNPTLINTIPVTKNAKAKALDLIDPEGSATRLVVGYFNEIQTFDVEDPLNCPHKFDYSCSNLNELEVHGDIICCSGSDMGVAGGLFILLYNDTLGITPTGAVDTPGDGRSIAVDWPYAFIGDGGPGLSVCNMTDLFIPTYQTSKLLAADGAASSIYGNLICTIMDAAGFMILDITDPVDPKAVYRKIVLNTPYYGDFIGDFLITHEGGDSYNALKCIDFSDPASPYVAIDMPLLSRVDMLRIYPETGLGFMVSGPGWTLFDMSNPINLIPLHSEVEGDTIDAIELNGDTLYVANGGNLSIYDISTIPPVLQNTVGCPSDTFWISFVDDYMYMSTSGLAMYSILDPYNPTPTSIYMTVEQCYQMKVVGDLLFIVQRDRLETLDITSPGMPTHINSVPLTSSPQFAMMITQDGQIAYVSGNTHTKVINLWPLNDQTILTTLEPDYYRMGAQGIIRDGLYYELGYPGGLRIYDLYN